MVDFPPCLIFMKNIWHPCFPLIMAIRLLRPFVWVPRVALRVHLSPLLSPIMPTFVLCVRLHEKTRPDFFQNFKMLFKGCTSALNYLLEIKSKNLITAKRKKLKPFLTNPNCQKYSWTLISILKRITFTILTSFGDKLLFNWFIINF